MESEIIVPVKLRKKYGSLFPGERAGFAASVAARMIANGDAFALDADGHSIAPVEQSGDQPDSDQPNSSKASRKPRNKPANVTPGSDAKSESKSDATPELKPPGKTTSTNDDPALQGFLLDGVSREVATQLLANGIENPDKLAEALHDEGRDLTFAFAGLDQNAVKDLRQIYAV